MKITVIGEFCTDIFVYGETKRLSPEAPVPVLTPVETVCTDGMASNVVRNIEAIGYNGTVNITYYTQDALLTKTRFVEKKSNHMFFRLDEGENQPIDQFNFDDVKGEHFDIVIVSDYDKGYLSNRDITRLGNLGEISILDSKRRLTHDMIDSYTWVKLNKKEAD